MNTNRDINKLNPNFKKKVELFLKEVGDKIFITEGFRSKERQDYLWSLGRTRPGRKRTSVRHSNHQEGIAIDIAFKGKELYPKDFNKWRQIADIAKKYGIDWGYDLWAKKYGFIDMPHFQDNGKPYKEELIVFGEDITFRGFTFPSSINNIPILLGKTSQKLYAISYIKGYTPNAKTNHIKIFKPFFDKFPNNRKRLEKLLVHEMFHQIQHRFFNKIEKNNQEDMFNRNNKKGFVSEYSKTNHWEYGAETLAYGLIYGKDLPEGKQWNGGIGVDFKYLYERLKKYITKL